MSLNVLPLLLIGCAAQGGAVAPAAEPPAPPPITPAQPAAAAPAGPVVLGQVRVVAGGDLIPHGSILTSAARLDQLDAAGLSTNHGGWGGLFADLAAELQAADLAFVNLETPIAPEHGRAPDPEAPQDRKVFNAPTLLLDALVSSGVDVVSFANNHVYDQGRKGFVETLDHLGQVPLTMLGAGRTCAEAAAPHVIEQNGLRLAWMGATRLHNLNLNRGLDEPCSNRFDLDALVATAQGARAAGADAVILSLHWGVEYETTPRDWDVNFAHALLDGGVDVILGHHPHVLQPVEVYRTKDGRDGVVAYSLGNLLSGQGLNYVAGATPSLGRRRDGVLFGFTLAKTQDPDRSVHTRVQALHADPVWSEPHTLSCLSEPGVGTRVRPVLNRVAAEQARTLAGVEPDPRRAAALRACAEHYEARAAVVQATLAIPSEALAEAVADE